MNTRPIAYKAIALPIELLRLFYICYIFKYLFFILRDDFLDLRSDFLDLIDVFLDLRTERRVLGEDFLDFLNLKTNSFAFGFKPFLLNSFSFSSSSSIRTNFAIDIGLLVFSCITFQSFLN